MLHKLKVRIYNAQSATYIVKNKYINRELLVYVYVFLVYSS